MGKYDDAIGGGKIILDVEEVLNEEAAKKVDDKIKKQKVDLGKPIEITFKSDRALQRLKELTSAAKQVKSELQEALSSKKSFEDINKLVSKYEILKKQIKAVTPEVDKNNDALKESSKVLKDTKKLVDQLTVSQDKLNKTKKAKTNTSTKKEVELTKDLANAAENVAKTQEKAAKTTLRTQQQVNAELEKEQKALKDIEAQQAKNDAAREKFKKKQANYGQEVFGIDAPVYDTDLVKGATEELKEFNQQLEARNKFQEKYNRLCRMVEKYYVSDEPGKYGIGAGDRYKDLDQFVELTSSMKELDALFVSGQKTTNKSINALFGNVIRDLQAQIKAAMAMIESGDGFGDQVGQKLDIEERNLNKEMQRLEEIRQAQLTKVNALRQEELDLIKKAGQEEAKVVAGQKQAESKNNLKFADGTLLNEKQVAAVEKYCKVLKKVMGDTYNEAKTLHHALQLVFDISNGNVGNIMDRFTSSNSASNAVLKMLTGMEVNNQKNRDAALRSINPEDYDHIIAERTEQARAKLAEEKTKFQREWDEFASVMLGGDAFKNETKLVKGKILKEFSQYADTAAEAIHTLNKAWLSGELEGKSGKTKWVQAYIDHLNGQKDYIDSIRDTKAGDMDVDSLFGLGGTTGLSEEKAKALRDEATAWDELIAKKKEYYGLEIPQVIEAPKVDEDELEIIQKENGALETKLELLQDLAEQYSNTVTQRDRNRYEELNQKDMDGGLTPRQEERYWELGEAIDEADRQLDEFGETYNRVVLKLANGKKIEILPEDAGLKKFDKIANEYYQGEYNGVDITDVIFERAQKTNDALLETEKVVNQTTVAHVEENKQLISSYEGLVEAVEKYVDANQRLWAAYDAQEDYSQAAKDRLSAVKQLLTYFPKNTISFGNSDHSADIYFESQEESRRYAEMGAEATLREVEARITLTRESQEQARLAREAAEATEAQTEAEEKLAAAAKKTTDAKKGQKGAGAKPKQDKDVFEDIIKKDLNDALEKLRSAKNNETTLFSLKGVLDGDNLVSEAEKMVKNIAEQAKLTLSKFNVKDDTIRVKLYNDELKVTVDQMYKLRAATEETENAMLELVSQSFSQDVKALNANTFDVDGVQQRALAAIEKVRSSLHGLEYDLTDLESAAKKITTQDDFVKFGNQLKAAQDNIQAIKNSTVSKNSMNPLANMQRDMQNANIEIETMRLKLDKFGDIQGVSEAKKMLEEMAIAAKKYNEATDAQGQQSAYNQYSNLRSSFKAQTEYINAAKSLNDSQKSTQKQTDPIKQQYQTILDLVNKINVANERMIKFQKMDGGSGLLGQQIANEQTKKLESIEKLNAVMEKLNVGNVLGGDKYTISDDIQSIGTDYSQITAFINDAGVQASLTTAEIEKLVKALQKAGDIDLSMISEALNASSAIDRAKKVAYENRYFDGKTAVSIDADGNTRTQIEDIQKLGVAGSTAKEQLEGLAKAIAQNSDGAVAMTKNFSQGADGIARLDFSVFDKNTNLMRDFTIELGTATQRFAAYETTVDKSAATMKAAEKQLMSMQATLRTLEAQGVDTNADTAAPQVKKLLEMINTLSAAMNSGEQGDILNTSKRAKVAQKDVERLQQQLVGLESAIENRSMTSLGIGNKNGNVYDQLVAQLPQLTKGYSGATVEVGAFDKATNTLNASVIQAGGAVEHYQLKMNALTGQMAAQKVGVGQLSDSWSTFKKTIVGAGKHLMTALVGYNVFYKAIAEVRKGVGYVKEIDLAMTELKKVTDETEESYRKFLDTAAGSAGKIGSTLSDFTEATANFARLNI